MKQKLQQQQQQQKLTVNEYNNNSSNMGEHNDNGNVNSIPPGLLWSSWAWGGGGGGFKSPPSINPKVLR